MESEKKEYEKLERVTVKQAAEELNMDHETVKYLMRKERLPIGYAVLREGCKRTTYYIYRDALDAYKKNMKMLGGNKR
ncbi:helix-turn-helix domain-containing protein [Thermoguttaceae bacterium LCP21S3_D4]|jgi:hypothetical protein|nr:DNA-binding protein [Lachnospiraceae bacterium]